MAKERDGTMHDALPQRTVTPRKLPGSGPRRPQPQADVLTLADDHGIGGDPYNSAERWVRPDRFDD